MVYIAVLETLLSKFLIHPKKKTQIAFLLTKKITSLYIYSDFINIFSKKKAIVLLEQTKLNKHSIKLEDGKQPPYRLIYSLGPVELEMLKTYIETHLKNSLILPSKFSAGTSILFHKKPNNSR